MSLSTCELLHFDGSPDSEIVVEEKNTSPIFIRGELSECGHEGEEG